MCQRTRLFCLIVLPLVLGKLCASALLESKQKEKAINSVDVIMHTRERANDVPEISSSACMNNQTEKFFLVIGNVRSVNDLADNAEVNNMDRIEELIDLLQQANNCITEFFAGRHEKVKSDKFVHMMKTKNPKPKAMNDNLSGLAVRLSDAEKMLENLAQQDMEYEQIRREATKIFHPLTASVKIVQKRMLSFLEKIIHTGNRALEDMIKIHSKYQEHLLQPADEQPLENENQLNKECDDDLEELGKNQEIIYIFLVEAHYVYTRLKQSINSINPAILHWFLFVVIVIVCKFSDKIGLLMETVNRIENEFIEEVANILGLNYNIQIQVLNFEEVLINEEGDEQPEQVDEEQDVLEEDGEQVDEIADEQIDEVVEQAEEQFIYEEVVERAFCEDYAEQVYEIAYKKVDEQLAYAEVDKVGEQVDEIVYEKFKEQDDEEVDEKVVHEEVDEVVEQVVHEYVKQVDEKVQEQVEEQQVDEKFFHEEVVEEIYEKVGEQVYEQFEEQVDRQVLCEEIEKWLQEADDYIEKVDNIVEQFFHDKDVDEFREIVYERIEQQVDEQQVDEKFVTEEVDQVVEQVDQTACEQVDEEMVHEEFVEQVDEIFGEQVYEHDEQVD